MATKKDTKKTIKKTTTKDTKKGAKKGTKKERPVYDLEIKVTRVFDGKYGVLFDMTVNHVCINGCRVVSTEEGEAFIGFPQKKSKKDDKWWNIAYVPLSDEQTSDILEQVEGMLAGEDEDEDEDEEEDEE